LQTRKVRVKTFTGMFTMTATQIKRVLRENRRRRVRPWALKHIADDRGISRSMVTTAVKTPARYPSLRQHIESVLVASAQKAS
jgi:hypothetical protein